MRKATRNVYKPEEDTGRETTPAPVGASQKRKTRGRV